MIGASCCYDNVGTDFCVHFFGYRSDVCEVCEIDEAKYTCPACETRSCSLKCVTAHKKDSDCDGIRPRTSYVSLEKFTDLHFLNGELIVILCSGC